MDEKSREEMKARRGEDPRLDALAEALSEIVATGGRNGALFDLDEDRDVDDEGGGEELEAAPGLMVSGGMKEARAHVAKLPIPDHVDPATLEMRKVVVAKEGARRRGASAKRAGETSRESAARWKGIAVGAVFVGVSVGIFGVLWFLERGRGREESSVAVAAKERLSGADDAVMSARAGGGMPGMPTTQATTACAPTSAPASPAAAVHGSARPSASVGPSAAPSASAAPSVTPTAKPTSMSPSASVPDTSSLEF